MERVNWILGFLILLGIIFLGIFFDVLGIASAAAEERPFHAMASERMIGSRQAILVVRNADQFANFCNDVVGDISGILSGAAAISVLAQMVRRFPELGYWEAAANVLMTALVAAMTVGGKALGKTFAMQNANPIVLQVGRVLFFLEHRLHIRFFAKSQSRTGRGL